MLWEMDQRNKKSQKLTKKERKDLIKSRKQAKQLLKNDVVHDVFDSIYFCGLVVDSIRTKSNVLRIGGELMNITKAVSKKWYETTLPYFWYEIRVIVGMVDSLTRKKVKSVVCCYYAHNLNIFPEISKQLHVKIYTKKVFLAMELDKSEIYNKKNMNPVPIHEIESGNGFCDHAYVGTLDWN